MKIYKIVIFVGLLSWASVFQGQDNHPPVLTCEDVAENCAALFARYYQAGKMDSVAMILDYWEGKCGNTEQIQRARILFAIDQKQYRDAVLKPGILDNVLDYKEKASESKKNADEFDLFTKQLAASIMTRYSKSGIQYAWCEFYGENSDRLLKRIQNHEFGESALAQEYFAEVAKLKTGGSFNMAILVGSWIPFGKLSKLGTHPEIGYSAGGCIGRFNIDVSVGYRFLHTSVAEIQHENINIETNTFSGYFLGIDAGVMIFRIQKNELLCVGGFGYENFTVIRNKGIPHIESRYMNLGVAYRRYFRHNTYCGIQLKYNKMNYLSGSAFKDSGNVLLTRIFFGWMSGGKKAEKLSRLQY